jgi:tellurium resistance protein TerD
MSKFNINKGDKFAIAKAISRFRLELGWEEGGSKPIDVDAHAFGLIAGNKFFNDASHAVTYANPALKKGSGGSFGTHDDSIIHTGDNRTGKGDGADEVILIDTALLPAEITEIGIFITIHEAGARGQDFSQVRDAFIRLIDDGSGNELFNYNLATEFGSVPSVEIGRLVKDNGEWKFEAMAAGFKQELGDILDMLS